MIELKFSELINFLSLFFHNDMKCRIWSRFDCHNHYFLLSDFSRSDDNRLARDFMKQYNDYQVISFNWKYTTDYELQITI